VAVRSICSHINIELFSLYNSIFPLMSMLCWKRKYDLFLQTLSLFTIYFWELYIYVDYHYVWSDLLGEYCQKWSNDKWWCFGRSNSSKPAACDARSLLSTAQVGHRGGFLNWLFVELYVFYWKWFILKVVEIMKNFSFYRMLKEFMHHMYDLIFIGISVLEVAPIHSFPAKY